MTATESSMPAEGRPPRVLQVLPRLVSGGVERGTIEISSALAAAGWDSYVASAGGKMTHELSRHGATHITLPLASKNPLVMHGNIARLAALIEEHDIDIVHARSRAPAWSAWAASRRTGRHFVTTFHNAYGDATRLRRWYNSVMGRGERVIAISYFVAEYATMVYGIGADRLRVIHRGVDLARFDPQRVSAERVIQLAKQWRLPDDRPIVMLPGRLTRWKGQLDLVNAIAALGHRDLLCLLVGSDEGRPAFRRELEATIATRGLGEVFQLVDDCNDMPAALMLADVVVSASNRPEGFGRVVVEAQAMGRPVIATDHGGARETILPNETGWLVPPGNAQALAAAIAEALALSGDERAVLAERAIADTRTRFGIERMCAETLAVYREILFPAEHAAMVARDPEAA
jgi:glycosyltransferase involved in cell wall biosynthesis